MPDIKKVTPPPSKVKKVDAAKKKASQYRELLRPLLEHNISLDYLFWGFNAAVIALGGFSIHLIRIMSSHTLLILLIDVIWAFILVLFVLLVTALRKSNRSTKTGIIGLSLFEIIFLILLTQNAFAYIPVDIRNAELARLSQAIIELNGSLSQDPQNPSPIVQRTFASGEALTVERTSFKGHVLVFRYSTHEKEGTYWIEQDLRKDLMPETCHYFDLYSKYGTLVKVIHLFSSSKKKFSITFYKDDCTAPTAPLQKTNTVQP